MTGPRSKHRLGVLNQYLGPTTDTESFNLGHGIRRDERDWGIDDHRRYDREADPRSFREKY